MKLEGKTALVTGAGSGLGAAICRAFAAEGARVCVTDINLAAAQEVAKRCDALTAGAVALLCDVSDSGSVAAAFSAFDDTLGDLDILVNNAGIVHENADYVDSLRHAMEAQMMEIAAGGPVSTHMETVTMLSDEMFDRMLKIHLYGTFYCTREAIRRMRERGAGGRIINMGSIMGSTSLAGAPDYCAAKGGVMAFTRAVAREAASYGVLVNSLSPGFIDTPLLNQMEEQQRRIIAMQTPLGRLGTVEEIAGAAVFLAGPDATFFTGQTLSANGGLYMSQ